MHVPNAGLIAKACATVAASLVVFVACAGSPAPIAAPTASPTASIPVPAAPLLRASVEPSPPDQTSEPSPAEAEIRLHGTIVGHTDDAPTNPSSYRSVADATMDVQFRLSPNRALVDGTFSVSGEMTLDCRFSASGTGVIKWDSNNPRSLFVPGQANAQVSLAMADPRYFAPGQEMKLFVVFVGAMVDQRGGTCGYSSGIVSPADPQLLVTGFSPCNTIEVQRVDALTWSGDCSMPKGEGVATVKVRLSQDP